MTREIVITVRPDGSVQIEAAGFAGRECLRATQDFEQSLGAVTGRKYKPVITQEADAGEVGSGEVFGKNRC
ncbi:MAG: DUF2997 domain-containing protein [Bacillota bacterium]